MEECTGLAVDPSLAGVVVALAAAAPLEFGRAAKALRNVGVVDESAAAFGVLLPVSGTVENGLVEQVLVAQVGGVIEGLDKLDSVSVNTSTPSGVAGGDGLEGGKKVLFGHGFGSFYGLS